MEQCSEAVMHRAQVLVQSPDPLILSQGTFLPGSHWPTMNISSYKTCAICIISLQAEYIASVDMKGYYVIVFVTNHLVLGTKNTRYEKYIYALKLESSCNSNDLSVACCF